jgi:hypothetical protein
MGTELPTNSCHRVPGPTPIFTERTVVKLRADQRRAVARIANVLHLSVSDVIRWFIEVATASIEATAQYDLLTRPRRSDA